ncbi:unnamed protein product [Brassica rapa subsp. narinosa]
MHKASRRRSDHALTLHNLARTLHNPKTPQMVELCTLGLSRSVQVRTGPYQSVRPRPNLAHSPICSQTHF